MASSGPVSRRWWRQVFRKSSCAGGESSTASCDQKGISRKAGPESEPLTMAHQDLISCRLGSSGEELGADLRTGRGPHELSQPDTPRQSQNPAGNPLIDVLFELIGNRNAERDHSSSLELGCTAITESLGHLHSGGVDSQRVIELHSANQILLLPASGTQGARARGAAAEAARFRHSPAVRQEKVLLNHSNQYWNRQEAAEQRSRRRPRALQSGIGTIN